MLRPELKYGLIAGLGISLWFYGEFLLGFRTAQPTPSQLSSLVLIFSLWPMLRQRQLAIGPAFQLPGALRAGLFASLVTGTIFYIAIVLYRLLLNPDWLVNELNWLIANLRAAGTDEGLIQQNAENYRSYVISYKFLLNTLYYWTIQGALYSIFLTFWLKWRHREKAK